MSNSVDLQQQLDLMTRRLERERKARKEAEVLLESKSLALYRANQVLQQQTQELEGRIQTRTTELQDREQQLAEAQRIGQFGHWTWDLVNGKGTWSDELYRLFGYAPDEVLPSSEVFFARVHPEDISRTGFFDGTNVDQMPDRYETQFRMVLPNGEIRHIFETGQKVYNDNGEVIRITGVAQNITTQVEVASRLALQADILRSIGNLVLVANSAGKVTFVSDSVEAILGFKPEEILNEGWWRVGRRNRAEDIVEERQYIMSAASGHAYSDPTPHEHYLQHKDGSWRCLLISDTKGPGDSIIGVCTDITERKLAEEALRESEQRYRQFVESASDVIYQTDSRGRFVYANPVAMRLMGFKSEADYQNKVFFSFIAVNQRRQLRRACYEQARDRVPNIYHEILVTTADGREVWLGQNGQVLYEGEEVTGFQAVARDITERKAMEQQLAKARDQALEASRLKSEFLAIMSHEIRTPMNAVIGMSELLLDSPLSREQHELAHSVNESAQALLVLINDILDFSKIEAGRLTIEYVPFDLPEVIRGALSTIVPKARERHLQLDLTMAQNMPHHIIGDPNRLRQVLLNLLSNAVKFTAQGSVHLKARVTDNQLLQFEVIDTGIGLSSTAKRRLFQPFVQADGSITRRYGGTGLGLTISKRLVKMMGGAIDVESEEGRGARFHFTVAFQAYAAGLEDKQDKERMKDDAGTDLRVRNDGHLGDGTSPSQKQMIKSTATATSTKSSARILVVDDNLANQRIISLQLQKMGYSCQTAANGIEAVRVMSQQLDARCPFDLVLMDCQMPEMDGFSATREIRRCERAFAHHTPIIAVTASNMQGDREACIVAGMDDYLSKPIRMDALRAVVQRWLEQPAAQVDAADIQMQTLDLKPGLNTETLHEVMDAIGGDADALRDIVETFIDETARHVRGLSEQAQAAATVEAAKNIAYHAHTIKGSAAAMGAVALSQAASILEQATKQGPLNSTTANTHVGIIQTEYVRACQLLKEAVASCFLNAIDPSSHT